MEVNIAPGGWDSWDSGSLPLGHGFEKAPISPAEWTFRAMVVVAVAAALTAIAGGTMMGVGHARELPQVADIGKQLALGGGIAFVALGSGAIAAKVIKIRQDKSRYVLFEYEDDFGGIGKRSLSKAGKAYWAFLAVAILGGLTLIGGGVAMGVGHFRKLPQVADIGMKVMAGGALGAGGGLVGVIVAKRIVHNQRLDDWGGPFGSTTDSVDLGWEE